MSSRHRVVVIGGGFGGLRAARALKNAPVDVTVIDQRNYHLFQPLLYQVATGSLSPGEIASPLRGVLGNQPNTRVLLGEVNDIEPDARRVRLADGEEIGFDSLIVATGARSHYYGNDAWSQWAPSMKSIEEATEIRHKILYAFEVAERLSVPEERRAWLTFVIVGAGATGVELAGAIAEIARQTLRHDFRSIHPEEARIVLVDGGPRILATFPEDLAEKAKATLEKLGVVVKTGVRVQEIDKEGVTGHTPDGDARVAARTVIWAGGIVASSLGRTLAERTKAKTDRSGRIQVGPDLTIAGYPDIYVVGDLALSIDAKGQPLGGVAQVAMQQGTYAGKAIVRKVLQRPAPRPFRYFDKGTLAVIGRWKAVANVFGVHLSGLPAWLVWALIHVMYLVEFESRVLVFIQWAIQDLTFSRGARLITGRAPTDFSFEEAVATSARNRSAPVEERGEADPATAWAAEEPPDSSPPPGRLTVFGLLALGAFPVLGFCVWLLLTVGRHVPAAGGGNVPSILSPASGHAKSLMDLSIFVFAVTGTIFAVVFGLLANALLRYRKRSRREPPQVYGSSRIEVAWTIVPVLIVVVLFLSTARVIHAVQDARRPAGALDVTVVGHQFWWEFRYPSLGIVTANELHVPVSDPEHPRPTYLKLLSADTDHSFWVPELGGKTDLIPNRVNRTWIDPHRAGLYLGQCAQYCGTQHGKMLLRVVVDSPEDFDAWVRTQRQPVARDERAAAGRRVFETTACINCHAIGDTVATGTYGPDLTHLMSRSTIAAGAAENTGQNLQRWIENPDSIKPGSLMPAMKLTAGDLDALVAYMQTLR